jgi:hypothetical protein
MLLFRFVCQKKFTCAGSDQNRKKYVTARNVPVKKSPIYITLLYRMLQDHSRPVSPVVHTFQVFSMREERGTNTNFTGPVPFPNAVHFVPYHRILVIGTYLAA